MNYLANSVQEKLKRFSGSKRGRILIYVPLVVLFMLLGYVGYLYIVLAPQLANADFVNAFPMTSKILDRNGELLYEIGGEVQRTVIPSEEIPEILKKATIAAEDKNFYHHIGIDPKAILRAMFANIKAGGIAQGGSTITQQLAKNAFLTPEKTLTRKIQEAVIAIIIEDQLTKDEILTAYLNSVPYGGNILGVQKASEVFFGKNPKDLTLAEAATLAALPRAPGALSPYNGNIDELRQRRDEILQTLREQNAITDEELAVAKATDIQVKPLVHKIIAPHFTLLVREQLIQQFGKEKVEKGGLIVRTTLDSKLQAEAERIVANHRRRINGWGANNAGAVILDPKTGEVLAMVGSFDFYDTQIDGQVNVTTSPRQPGSAFKPIVYSALFTHTSYSPASVLYDVKTTFGNWTPRNYSGDHYGPCTIRLCLAGSLNIPAVKAASLVGLDKVLDNAEKLGLTTLRNRDSYGLSLALGAGEVKPVEMAAAFGAFANNGQFTPPAMILSVLDNNGKELFAYQPTAQQVLPAEVAYQINSILSDNNARSFIFGSRSPLAFGGQAVAAKTGTTSFYKDAWTVGYTRSRVVAVWTGNSNGAVMRNGADGVFVAAPLWRDLLTKAMEGLSYENFTPPEGLRLVNVQTVRGSVNEYLASWQITGDLGQLALHSEQPNNPAWEKPVQDYWQRRNEEEAKNNPPPPPPDNNSGVNEDDEDEDDEPPKDLGGSPEGDSFEQSRNSNEKTEGPPNSLPNFPFPAIPFPNR